MNKVYPITMGFPSGQGKLVIQNPTTLSFSAHNGSSIFISDNTYSISSAVTCDNADDLLEGGTVASNTTYNVFVFDLAGTLTMALSNTPVTLNSSVGYMHRQGSPAQAFVGIVTTDNAGDFLTVYSFFNTDKNYFLDRKNHTGGQDASTITSGIIDIARLPATALSTLFPVADQAARFALTTADVQNGDTILQVSPNNEMYFVVDDTNLDNATGYQLYTASSAWVSLSGKPQILVDLSAITSPTNGDYLFFDGSNWIVKQHTQIIADLEAIVTPNNKDIMQFNGSNWVKISISDLKTDLSLNKKDVIRGTVGTLTSTAGEVSINLNTVENYSKLLLTEDVTSWNFSNLPPANTYIEFDILIQQDSGLAYACAAPAPQNNGAAWVVTANLSEVELIKIQVFSDGTRYMFAKGVFVNN